MTVPKTAFMSEVKGWLDGKIINLNYAKTDDFYNYSTKFKFCCPNPTSKKNGIAISAEKRYIPGIMRKKIHFLANRFAILSLIIDKARITAITP